MTSTEREPSWYERFNPRDWNLAVKLVVVGLVPTLLALTLGVLRVADQADVAAAIGLDNRALQVREQVAATAEALRAERNSAVLFVAAGRTADPAALRSAFAVTDAHLDKFRDALADADSLDTTSASALRQTVGALAQLPVLRSATAGGSVQIDDVTSRYTAIGQGVDVLDRSLLRQVRTPGVSRLADALSAVGSAREQLALEHTVLGGAIVASQVREADRITVSKADDAFGDALAQYQLALTPEQVSRFGNISAAGANGDLAQLKSEILATPSTRSVLVDQAAWDSAYGAAAAALDKSGTAIRDDLTSTSAAAEERASNLAGINSVILMLGLLLGVAIIVLLTRSMIRSLRVLRNSALDVAQIRLPQAVENMRAGGTPNVTVAPVPLSSRDEIGQVARAFDAVHGQAVRLAAEQAALQAGVSSMFVNLSRRSQALVERQLQLIEQLESNEQDPDQLSNLFQLDSLATRMRRNSENLLVLAGTEVAKRNVAPIAVVDVLRAAVSEIEQYQRVIVQSPPTSRIVGRAASDLVHLLSELLDNATSFSPPDSQVVMSTTRTAEGSILVEIADRGVGMTDDELAEVNQRLGGPAAVDVSASRRMGLFVVGRLAARHGIGVRLGTSPHGAQRGLTASVTVPSHLVPSSGRDIESPAGAGVVPARGVESPSSRRTATNGHGRPSALSALVAGAVEPSSLPGSSGTRSAEPVLPPPSNGSAGKSTTNGSVRSSVGAAAQRYSKTPQSETVWEQLSTVDEQGDNGRLPRSADPGPHGGGPSGTAGERNGVVRPTVAPTTSQPQDGLFAPSVPVIAEPDPDRNGGSRHRGTEPRPANPSALDDLGDLGDLGEATPIFEAIASAWFRASRPVPVSWTAAETGESRQAQASAEVGKAGGSGQPDADAATTDEGFAGPADDGWRSAQRTAAAPGSEELTMAGLPKRRPRARLVPGSAGSAVLVAPSVSSRNADAIRGRLASYQQGVRQARESRLRQLAQSEQSGRDTQPASAGAQQDEETP